MSQLIINMDGCMKSIDFMPRYLKVVDIQMRFLL